MEYKCQKLSSEKVLYLLKEADDSFMPPLSQNIPYTMAEYAEKLSLNAMFVLCYNNQEVIGFTAYYLNMEGQFAYIPQIWVSDKYQRRGIGSSMIDELTMLLPVGIKKIRLEVRKNNEKACSFYIKCNYNVIEDRNEKCLLEKQLNEKH